MNAIHTQVRFVEWFNAEDMHKASLNWLSELRFIKDEHHFFEDLIKLYTLQLIEPKKFPKTKEIVQALLKSKKRNNQLIEIVQIHENGLQIMLDGIDQLEEEEVYKKEHRELIVTISDFVKNYRTLKTQLFNRR